MAGGAGRLEPPPGDAGLLRWRIVGSGDRVSRWHTAADFRGRMLDAALFHCVSAPGTQQNHKGRPGRFSFYLTRQLALADGRYTIEVQASTPATTAWTHGSTSSSPTGPSATSGALAPSGKRGGRSA
jgi:hypothetical protein